MSAVPFGATQGTSYTTYINSVLGENKADDRDNNNQRAPGSHVEESRVYNISYMLKGKRVTYHRQAAVALKYENEKLFHSLERSVRLGEGAQGLVWLCKTPDGKQLVIKDLEFETQQDAQACFKQSMRFTSLRHVHLISYLAGERGTQLDASGAKMTHYVSILMPYYPDGDVQKLIAHGSRLSWQSISSLGLQIATALEYLHKLSTPVVHGDIKPENILLYSNKEQCVLMDLDTARDSEHRDQDGNYSDKLPLGTFEWMSPEAATGKPITTQSDIWSLGLVLFAMATLPDFMMFEHPRTKQTTVLNQKEWTAQDLRSVLTADLDAAKCPKVLRDVILPMVVPDPAQRYTATNVIAGLHHACENIILGLCQ